MSFILFITFVHALLGSSQGLEALVRDAAQGHIEQTYPEIAPRLDVRVTRVSLDAVAPPIRIAFQRPGVPRAHAKVDVLQRTSGGWERAGWALLYVSHFDSVAVPVRDVPRGEPVGAGDVIGAWIETTRFSGTPVQITRFRAGALSEGVVADRTLRAGKPIREGDLRTPWAVETGGAMTVIYERPGLALKLNARAREPGSVGDQIRAYCADTGATYRVRLTDAGRGIWIKTL